MSWHFTLPLKPKQASLLLDFRQRIARAERYGALALVLYIAILLKSCFPSLELLKKKPDRPLDRLKSIQVLKMEAPFDDKPPQMASVEIAHQSDLDNDRELLARLGKKQVLKVGCPTLQPDTTAVTCPLGLIKSRETLGFSLC